MLAFLKPLVFFSLSSRSGLILVLTKANAFLEIFYISENK